MARAAGSSILANHFPGKTNESVGRDRVRDMLTLMIRSKTKLQRRVVKGTSDDDVAVLYTDFQGTTMDVLGKTIEVRYNAIKVLRRRAEL